MASLSRPGGNVTGVSFLSAGADLQSKQLELLREVVPKAAVIGVLVNPTVPDWRSRKKCGSGGARPRPADSHLERRQRSIPKGLSDPGQQERVRSSSGRCGFAGQHDRLAALAARHAVPAIEALREFVAAGGLMSYGASITDAYRQVGVYTGRILKGVKPADLPVMLPTKFEWWSISRPPRRSA